MKVSSDSWFWQFHQKGVTGRPCVPDRNPGRRERDRAQKGQRVQDQKASGKPGKQPHFGNVKESVPERESFIMGDTNYDFEGLGFHGIKLSKV